MKNGYDEPTSIFENGKNNHRNKDKSIEGIQSTRERKRLKTKSQTPVRQYGEVYCFSSYIQACDPFELTFMEDMR